MRKRFYFAASLCALSLATSAQKIDFDMSGRQSKEVTEPGYTGWAVRQGLADTLKSVNGEEGFDIVVNCGPEGTVNRALRPQWNKGMVTDARKARLVGDCVAVLGLDDDNNTPELTSESATLNLVIKGMEAGRHTMLAYLNCMKKEGESAPIDVIVNGNTVFSGIKMSNQAEIPSASGQVYISFDAVEGQDVNISFVSRPQPDVTYVTTGIYVNAIIFDQPNPKTTALNPVPANRDFHLDADEGSVSLKWTAADIAVKHKLYVGTSENDWSLINGAEIAEPEYILGNLTTHNTYYWRVDEVDADGNEYQGEVWTFRPRRLAFPGAEGYGRYAIGGRGGVVYHVTSLEDYADAETPIPGTFRYGIKEVKGPRTIVFDVEGTITLKSRLTCNDPYVTVAGQTAPGKGILFRSSPFGMANDGITRFLRLRLGYHNGDTSKGLDGMGMAGNDYSIMDHCSVGWTIDEAFSSRNSKNITLQRTLISEALNCADHPNYPPGKTHGFAATIGGDIGSYHHNLLAHNAGRNWSLGGGLDGSGYAAGRSDIFNNVCYNWEGRTTDGGTHECNFVGNYYKMGPESDTKFLLTAQLEAVGKGTQSYYVNGNIRENKDGTLTEDKEGDTYNYQKADAVDLNWDLFVDKPFFESMATVEPARKAFKTVLSDVGASQPFFDEHDVRMVNETLNGTTSTKGCKTGMRGLVDRETDSEGFSYFVAAGQTRPAGYDTDQDGMPDWWEIAKGTNPDTPDNNEYQDNFGYTNLEQYLNWVAEPNFMMTPGTAKTVDLSSLFLGYNKNPWYTVEGDTPAGWDVSLDGSILTVSTSADAQALAVIRVSANDEEASGDDQKMLRSINFCSTTMAAGVEGPVTVDDNPYTVCQIYSVNGVLLKNGNDLSSLPKGIYILKAINGDRVKSVKVVNR